MYFSDKTEKESLAQNFGEHDEKESQSSGSNLKSSENNETYSTNHRSETDREEVVE